MTAVLSTEPIDQIGSSDGNAESLPPSASWMMVVLLCIFYILSLLDRNLFVLLIEPIKQDLDLSDVQIGLLGGLAFSIFFSGAALPIGWAVDRFSRRSVICAGVVTWSLATAATGFCNNYRALFAARAIVGAGEATIAPAGHSIIADAFPPERLSLPMSLFGASTKAGIGLSFVIGGLLTTQIIPSADYEMFRGLTLRGWQLIFVVIGLPGALLGFLIFAIPEPSRTAKKTSEKVTYPAYLKLFWSRRRFMLNSHGGHLLMTSVSTALSTWTTPFLMRKYDWPISRAGLVMGLLTLIALIAVPLHGMWVDRKFSNGDLDAHLRHMSLMCLIALPFGAAAYFLSSVWVSLAFIAMVLVLVGTYMGLGNSAILLDLPSHFRGKASSIIMLLSTAGGFALGAAGPAAISQYLFEGSETIGLGVSAYLAIALGLACIFYRMARRGPIEYATLRSNPVVITANARARR